MYQVFAAKFRFFSALCLALFQFGSVVANQTFGDQERLAHEAFLNRDYARSYELYTKLADQGVGAGHFNKGVQLINGLGVSADPVRAMEAFLSASQLGVIKAKTQIGVMYFEGKGVTKSVHLAIRWLNEAKGDGDLEASLHLARLYLKGDGTPRDPPSALRELRIIAAGKSRTKEWISLASASVELWMVGVSTPRRDALAQLSIDESDMRELGLSNETLVMNRQKTLALEEEVKKLSKERADAERRAEEALKLAEKSSLNASIQSSIPKIDFVQKPTDLQYLDVHALVIGNGAYSGSARLRNPVNDAKVVSAKLREFGFTVTQLLDTDRKRLVQGLASFSKTASSADIVILFYAGHGVQLFGTNYLLPTDVDVDDVAQASLQSISLNMILEQYLPGKTRLVFLDACRDNPLNRSNTRGVSRGLAPISVAEGTLIAYSTRDGGVAVDGEGDNNSPFAKALVNNIGKEEDIAVILRRVRQAVMVATNNRQTPWEYGSLTGDSLILANIRPKREGKK